MGEALAAAMLATRPFPDVGAVTWVPLGRRRLAERGFDQAKLLARATARGLGLPLVPLAKRATATAPQARRPAADRRTAMKGAFVPTRRPAPPTVLLVDDVLTTGATAAACGEALLEAGVRQVHVLTAARALSGPAPRAYTRSGPRPGLWLPGEPPR